MSLRDKLAAMTPEQLQDDIDTNLSMGGIIASVGGAVVLIARFMEDKTGGQIFDGAFAASLFGWSVGMARQAFVGARLCDVTKPSASDAPLLPGEYSAPQTTVSTPEIHIPVETAELAEAPYSPPYLIIDTTHEQPAA